MQRPVTEEEEESCYRAEKNLMESKIFKLHKTAKMKQNEKPEEAEAGLKEHSMHSLRELLLMDPSILDS